MRLLSDTTPAAAAIQLRVLRGLTAAQRLELAVQMSQTARALVAARLRAEHPDWSAKRLSREVTRLTGGVLPPHLE